MMRIVSRTWIGLAAVLAIAGILFSPSLQFPFIWDDAAVIRDNPFIHTPISPGLFFRPQFWQQLLPVSRFDYRPLQMLTLSAISRLGGRNPLYYRSANLALHLLSVVLLFSLARRMSVRRAAALLAAALFAFHPVHIETIVCARNISELAVTALLLAAFLLILRPGRRLAVGGLFVFIVALLYKESALIFPVLLTILVAAVPGKTESRKAGLRKTIPFWLLAIVGGVGKALISSGAALADPPPVPHLLAGAGRLLVTNLRLLTFPVRLKVLYHFPRPESWTEPVWFFSLAAVVILAGVLVAARKNQPVFAIFACLTVSLLPSLSRVGTAGRVVAEQRLYLPSVFFCLAIAMVMETILTSSPRWGRRTIGFSLVLISWFLIGLSADYLLDWRDELSLWRRVTAYSPRAGLAFNNLAITLSRTGDDEGAQRGWRRALELDPRLPEAHTNLGIIQGREERWDEAADHFLDALEADPSHHPAAIYLAQTYRKLNRDQEAVELLKMIRRQNPSHPEAANELAIIFEKMGRGREAAGLYREAADLNPEYAAPLRNLATFYKERGEYELALAAGREALERRPDQPRGYVTLANIYITSGRLKEAKNILRQGALDHPENWQIKSRLLAVDSVAPD